MKIRTLTVCLLAACFMTETAFAQISATMDATKDAVIVSGTASDNEAQIVLLKPGFTVEDAENAVASDNKSDLENVIEYFGQVTAKDKNVETVIPMRSDADKGEYLLIVDNALSAVNFASFADRAGNMVPAAKTALSDGSFAAFVEGDGKYFCNSDLLGKLEKKSNVAKYSAALLDKSKNLSDAEFMEEMPSALNMGIVMEALNENKITDIGTIRSMTDGSGLAVPSEKIDLIEEDKKNNIISDISGKNFASEEDYEKKLSESIFINVLYNAENMTNESKKEFFEAYAKKLGLDIEKYEKLTSNKKEEAIAKLLTTNNTSLNALQSALDGICDGISAVTTNLGGGGSGGSGGSSGGGGSNGIRAVYPDTTGTGAVIGGGLSDLSQCEWARPAIEFLVKSNMISGYEDNTFKPSKNISRAEFISIIARKYLPGNNYTGSFSDVVSGSWYFDHVESAFNNGIISGKDNGIFAPDENISRQDMAVILYRLAVFLGRGISEAREEFLDDAEIAEYAKAAVYGLRGARVINGDENGNFNPNASATRAEAAQMIYGFVKYLAE